MTCVATPAPQPWRQQRHAQHRRRSHLARCPAAPCGCAAGQRQWALRHPSDAHRRSTSSARHAPRPSARAAR